MQVAVLEEPLLSDWHDWILPCNSVAVTEMLKAGTGQLHQEKLLTRLFIWNLPTS
ncbi:hypothetical protein [Paenibacillus plantarum]|uniref:hypothetical protein n=1 Tax=Paenibacillus plantarum TaxID=2654975 RepID=UPI001490FB54|nr:hypothetical protein [Paenibacillus plantarum]